MTAIASHCVTWYHNTSPLPRLFTLHSPDFTILHNRLKISRIEDISDANC